MRVLLATDTYEPTLNGIVVFTKRLAEKLDAAGHEVSVLAPAGPRRTSQAASAGYAVRAIHSLPLLVHPHARLPVVLRVSHVAKLLRELQPEVVHVQTPWLLGAGAVHACAAAEVPIVVTHHVRPENFLPYLPRRLHRVATHLFWRRTSGLYLRVPLVIAPSQTGRALLAAHADVHHVEVVSNGVDLDQFHPGRASSDPLLERSSNHRPTVLYVGRLDRDKDVSMLRSVLELLVASVDCSVIVCGSGSEMRELQRFIRTRGLEAAVTLAGPVPQSEVANWYRMADVFIMTGESETQPIAALEAMASGLPIVGFQSPGVSDLVVDGQTGFLVPAGSPGAFCDRLAHLLENEPVRRKFGDQARQVALACHSFERTVEEYLGWYRYVGAAQGRRHVQLAG